MSPETAVRAPAARWRVGCLRHTSIVDGRDLATSGGSRFPDVPATSVSQDASQVVAGTQRDGLAEGANASRSKTQPLAVRGNAGRLAGVLFSGAALLATECRARQPAGNRRNQREAGTDHCGTGTRSYVRRDYRVAVNPGVSWN